MKRTEIPRAERLKIAELFNPNADFKSLAKALKILWLGEINMIEIYGDDWILFDSTIFISEILLRSASADESRRLLIHLVDNYFLDPFRVEIVDEGGVGVESTEEVIARLHDLIDYIREYSRHPFLGVQSLIEQWWDINKIYSLDKMILLSQWYKLGIMDSSSIVYDFHTFPPKRLEQDELRYLVQCPELEPGMNDLFISLDGGVVAIRPDESILFPLSEPVADAFFEFNLIVASRLLEPIL